MFRPRPQNHESGIAYNGKGGMEQSGQLVGLITRRSEVQILLPQPALLVPLHLLRAETGVTGHEAVFPTQMASRWSRSASSS